VVSARHGIYLYAFDNKIKRRKKAAIISSSSCVVNEKKGRKKNMGKAGR
jgi:hypothetical protein